ncbi:dipeptidase [Spirochaetia bacterium]|nr:dipeptidase [Spirochaetia bacterium]
MSDLQKNYQVIDLHCDSADMLRSGIDLRRPNPQGHVDLPRLKKGGVGIQVFAAYVPAVIPQGEAFSFAAKKLDAISVFARSDPALVLAESAGDCEAALTSGKIGILQAVENGLAIENSLDKLAELRRRKVRILTLVHSAHNAWAASCTGGEGMENGLSAFGEEVVVAMNDLGIIVDLSHSAESTFWAALKKSKKPVIASHSCAYALCAAPRNLKDDQLKALGDSGGLVGVNFFSGFLSEPYRRAWETDCADITGEGRQGAEQFRQARIPYDAPEWRDFRDRIDSRLAERLSPITVPFSLIADHIDYAVNIAGEDAVGLGSDFDGIFAAPQNTGGSDCYPLLQKELESRGYSHERIEKIFSRNFLRVLREYS